MKYLKIFEEFDDRGPYGTNPYQMGHENYDRDMEKSMKELDEYEKRRNDPTQFPSYNPNSGRGWTPETLVEYIKKRYNVDIPEEHRETILKIREYLNSLKDNK